MNLSLSNRKIRSRLLIFTVVTLIAGILLKFYWFAGETQKLLSSCDSEQHEQQCSEQSVVVLHGLVRSSGSMSKISQALNHAGYTVCNIQYPSRQHSIPKLAQDFVYQEIQDCFPGNQQPLNFVTHSMGGIIVRQLAQGTELQINRVVMLSPPNHGSALVDKLKIIPLFKLINGEAGLSLGTESSSIPNNLGAVSFEVGIVVGNKSFNPLYSYLIPGADDGKVAVESAKVSGMKDFLIVPHSHSFMMNSDVVIEQTINFINHGHFQLDRQTDS